MSIVTVVMPPVLRPFVGGEARLAVPATTLREALEALAGGSAPLRGQLFDESDAINRFVRVFIDGRAIAAAGAGEHPLANGAVVTILLALAGG